MAYSASVRSAIRRGYVQDGKDLAMLADEFRVPLRTVHNWKAADFRAGRDWDRERAGLMLGADAQSSLAYAVVPMFMRQIQAIIARVEQMAGEGQLDPVTAVDLLAKLADTLTKTTSALRRLDPGMNKIALGLEFVKLLMEFTRKRFPQHAPALQELLEPFGQELLQHLEKP